MNAFIDFIIRLGNAQGSWWSRVNDIGGVGLKKKENKDNCCGLLERKIWNGGKSVRSTCDLSWLPVILSASWSYCRKEEERNFGSVVN